MKIKNITVYMNGEMITMSRAEWIEMADKFLQEGDKIELVKLDY